MTPPRISHDTVTSILVANNCDLSHAAWIAIRGYFLDSEGAPGRNDRGLWDDAWALYSPQHGIVTYRANTDPTGFRPGTGTGDQRGRASLAPGLWLYGVGPHKGRPAFRQCAPVLVNRDQIGGGTYPHWGHHAINLHDAPGTSTSSEGCQTAQRAIFRILHPLFTTWIAEARNPWGRNDWNQRTRTFNYILLDETARRLGNIVAPTTYLNAP